MLTNWLDPRYEITKFLVGDQTQNKYLFLFFASFLAFFLPLLAFFGNQKSQNCLVIGWTPVKKKLVVSQPPPLGQGRPTRF